MKNLRNRYRNRLGASRLARFLMIGGIAATLGVVYVYIKNKQIILTGKCARLEKEISVLRDQVEAVEEDIVGVTGRDGLVERLERGGSILERLDPKRVVTIDREGRVLPPRDEVAFQENPKGGVER